MHMLFYVSVILLTGLVMAKVIRLLKLPNVTGYLLGGLLIGPSVLGIIPRDVVGSFSIISEAALAFIAYSIGSDLNIEHLKKIGKGVVLITFLEAIGATLCVTLGMIFIFRQPVHLSIVLGAIGAATAPAATLMVVKQYNAKGPLVDTLLPVVAMDDAVCIMIFGIASAIAKILLEGVESVSLASLILSPIFEIIGALALGFFMGFILAWISKKVKGEDELLSVIIAFIFLTTGLSIQFNFSSLLSCMMLGTTLTNILPHNKRVFTVIEHFTPPLLVLFFTISGVELNLSILKSVGLIGIAYVVLRAVGKMLGGYLGAAAAKSPKTVRNYLGFALLPQAGVAIGLSMVAQRILPAPYGDEIRTVILAAVIIYELIGPPLAKFALVKAGEIQSE